MNTEFHGRMSRRGLLQVAAGRVAIHWGVYGVPETFVVGADGRIADKHVGPVTDPALRETVLPLVERLYREANGGTA